MQIIKVHKLCIIVLFIGSVFTSCNQKTFASEEALLDYMKEESNKYVQYKSLNGINFSLTYRPTDLLVKQELTVDSSEIVLDSLRNKYKKYIYFNLRMSKNNQEVLTSVAGNRNQFGAMVNQLAFGMTERVHLYTSKKDTITMLDYVYPRMYGMGTSTNMLLVYPRDKKLVEEEYVNLSIEDIGLFTGEITFKIPTTPLNNEPGLDFK
ncbi:hypothetical protein [uncultured Aquimarina sp.]|uniref:hypothetical protein n=1 Tax=uncultured Aquimarina sp. TaxID=575652 RepID=UPI002603DA37|nr:hypothetical protein [uncultured Aquimarina sp.]